MLNALRHQRWDRNQALKEHAEEYRVLNALRHQRWDRFETPTELEKLFGAQRLAASEMGSACHFARWFGENGECAQRLAASEMGSV